MKWRQRERCAWTDHLEGLRSVVQHVTWHFVLLIHLCQVHKSLHQIITIKTRQCPFPRILLIVLPVDTRCWNKKFSLKFRKKTQIFLVHALLFGSLSSKDEDVRNRKCTLETLSNKADGELRPWWTAGSPSSINRYCTRVSNVQLWWVLPILFLPSVEVVIVVLWEKNKFLCRNVSLMCLDKSLICLHWSISGFSCCMWICTVALCPAFCN